MPTSTPVQVVTSLVRLSHYWPALGGVNCFWFAHGECLSRMSSGERWQDWIGRAAACPETMPFWTKIKLPGGEEFFCLDRGSKIVVGPDGIPWVDLLVEVPPVPFGTPISAVIEEPK